MRNQNFKAVNQVLSYYSDNVVAKKKEFYYYKNRLNTLICNRFFIIKSCVTSFTQLRICRKLVFIGL